MKIHPVEIIKEKYHPEVIKSWIARNIKPVEKRPPLRTKTCEGCGRKIDANMIKHNCPQ